MKELEAKNQELATERGKLDDASRKLGAERHKHIQEIADVRAEFEGRLSLPRVRVIQEDLDELAALRVRQGEYQDNLADVTRRADGFKLERDNLQKQCKCLTEVGNGMRGIMYEAGDMLRRRADEVRCHFLDLDDHPIQLAVALHSTMGGEASEEHNSEQSLFSCDPRDKPRISLPLLGNPLPRMTDTQDLGLGLDGQKGPHFRSPFGMLFRPIASTSTSLPVDRTPEIIPRPSALSLSHAVKLREGAESRIKAGDDASMVSASSGTNATNLQQPSENAEAAAPPVRETLSQYRQRIGKIEASAKRDTVERDCEMESVEEMEGRLASKATKAKGDPPGFNSPFWWTNNIFSNEPNRPAPQRGPNSEPINDGTTEPLSAGISTAPAFFNQPTKRKAPLPPTQPASKKQHTEHI